MSQGDLAAIIAVTVATGLIIFFGYKLFLFATFDQEVAGYYGVPTGWVDTLFSLVLAGIIVVSLQVLGATLIAASIVIPPIVARLVTDSFKKMVLVSTGLGAFCGLAGVYLSWYVDVSSGASVVLFSAAIFVLVIAFGSVKSHLLPTKRRLGRETTSISRGPVPFD